MNLALSEEQQMLKDTARRFLEKECPRTLVRELLAEQHGHSPELWRQMAELGWLGLPFPEQHGGWGADFLTLGVILEEMGRAPLPGAFVSTVLLGAYPVLEAGTEQQKSAILPRVASGDLLMTLAWLGTGAAYDPADVALIAKASGDDFVLDGVKLFVPNADTAEIILTVARVEGSDGVTILLADRSTDGIECTPLKVIDESSIHEVAYRGVRVPRERVLGAVGGGAPIVERALARAAVAECLQLVGCAQVALEMSIEHVKNRVQFGQPVGAFQAVQHHCANMATDLDGARFLAYKAAWALDQRELPAREVATAKAWVSNACHRIVSRAHQVHGGVGFIGEHDLTLYFKRIKAGEAAFGGANHHYRALSGALGL